MRSLIVLGVVVTLIGLGGLGWCIARSLAIRGAGLPPAEIQARLHRLIAINLGSVALAALGLAVLVVGLVL